MIQNFDKTEKLNEKTNLISPTSLTSSSKHTTLLSQSQDQLYRPRIND